MVTTQPMQPQENDEQCCAAHLWALQHIQQITVTFVTVVSAILTLLNVSKDPEPYHTSILSGQCCVNELLEDHPAHIHCELGVSHEVFLEMIVMLKPQVYTRSPR